MSEENLIYVVMGMTGEYSDRQEWLVGAYMKEKDAENRVSELENLLRVHGAHWDSDPEYKMRFDVESYLKNLPEGDAAISIDYTGTRYYVESVRLFE